MVSRKALLALAGVLLLCGCGPNVSDSDVGRVRAPDGFGVKECLTAEVAYDNGVDQIRAAAEAYIRKGGFKQHNSSETTINGKRKIGETYYSRDESQMIKLIEQGTAEKPLITFNLLAEGSEAFITAFRAEFGKFAEFSNSGTGTEKDGFAVTKVVNAKKTFLDNKDQVKSLLEKVIKDKSMSKKSSITFGSKETSKYVKDPFRIVLTTDGSLSVILEGPADFVNDLRDTLKSYK